MIKIELTDNKYIAAVRNDLMTDCLSKWGDSEMFLSPLFDKADRLAVAYDGQKPVGFTLAGTITNKNCIALAYLATRVLLEYRSQGVAKRLIKKISGDSVVKEKLLRPGNWSKPIYMVTTTANPVVYNGLSINFRVFPSPERELPVQLEQELVAGFARKYAGGARYDPSQFVFKEYFLGSAEHYVDPKNVPWANNKLNDEYIGSKLNLSAHAGDGLVLVLRSS